MKVNIQIKKSRPGKNPAFFLFYVLFLFIIYFLLVFLSKEPAITQQKRTPTVEEKPVPAAETAPHLVEHKISIKKDQSLSDILKDYGFSPQEIHRLREEVEPVYDMAKIKAGNEIRLFYEENGPFYCMEYDIDTEKYLKVQKSSSSYEAEILSLPIKTKIKLVWGVINDNLIQAVKEVGEKDSLAIAIADIFAWDIDFYADIRKNDSFELIFEKKYLDDNFIGYGNIIAAQFINQGNTFQAFRFTYPDTKKWDYFDPEGKSLRKEFLKSPINGARITSRFSYSRFHPIWKVYRPHYGVDYGAPVGTPVQATADGTVTFVGRNGAAGRMVRIRHKNSYETMYLHLRSYGSGIRKGAKVTSGQIVGYVGSSGASTGPHLDYRIRYHGKYVNPLAHKFKPVAPLREEYRNEFNAVVWGCELALAGPLSIFPGSTNSPLKPSIATSNR
jgi:murein DD-endopeptidase MepM/ murein hydrolase activator NlpD